MPVPIIVIGIGVVAGLTGVGTGIKGGVDSVHASKTLKSAKLKNEELNRKFEASSSAAVKSMDVVGQLQLETLASFESFSDAIEKIQNRPEFKEYKKDNIEIPKYNFEEIRRVAVGANIAMGTLSGAAAGTAGGFAAAGATTAAVAAIGVASTGTAISTLHGIAATNAILAALGGGAISAGGGGIALGTIVLGVASAGIGLLIGGTVFAATGGAVNEKAKLVEKQVELNEKQINYLCAHFKELNDYSQKYYIALNEAQEIYHIHLDRLTEIVDKKTDWNKFSDSEKLTVQNTVLLVGFLYKMCSVKLVNKGKDIVIYRDDSFRDEYLGLKSELLLADSDSKKKKINKKIEKSMGTEVAILQDIKSVNTKDINEIVKTENTFIEDIK